MNITLTPEWAQIVQTKVVCGQYLSPGEVVHEALILLEERDRLRQLRIEELRKELDKGLNQLNRGKFVEVNEALVASICQEGRRRLAERQQQANP